MAYSDLQDYLTRLENHGKLHWIEQRVDPSWEVSAITGISSTAMVGTNDRRWAFAKSATVHFPW